MSFIVMEVSNRDLIKAKQRASIKWLLSKAYNQKTPEELKEPFYPDRDDVDRLKPHIVHALANAELYCMALSHLYQDPNCHNLNHSGIISALGRKGVFVIEPSDCALTETMLIQTTPLKLSAHMAVIEALMILFIKESFSLERINITLKRLISFNKEFDNMEESLLAWINASVNLLSNQYMERNETEEKSNIPQFTPITKWSDLSDGTGLVNLIALYCPGELDWRDIYGSSSSIRQKSLENSLVKCQLVQKFCKESLPSNICHLSIEDLVYMHESIKMNVLCFLSDLYSIFEIKPLKIVVLPGLIKDQIIEVPDLGDRHNSSGLKQRHSSYTDRKDTSKDKEENHDYVVHRGRPVSTLSSLRPQNKEESSNESKSSESNVFERMKNIPVAGRPSDAHRTSFSGRRSRRNSIDDNSSQLSLENLGGSLENLSLLGRNPDKEMKSFTAHNGRKTPNTDRSILDNGDNEQGDDEEGYEGKMLSGFENNNEKVSFADLRKQKARDHFSGINITYMQYEKEDDDSKKKSSKVQNSNLASSKVLSSPEDVHSLTENPDAMAAQLNGVRMKLEMRRKRIEEEKKKMESAIAKQREQVGQQAFLRAVVVKGGEGNEENQKEVEKTNSNGPVNLQDVKKDLSYVSSKWLNDSSPKSPTDSESYSKSLHAMTDSLYDLQSDIQRLSQQQNQIQQMMSSPVRVSDTHSEGFYSTPENNHQRRTWGQPQPISFSREPPWPQRPLWPSPHPNLMTPAFYPSNTYDPYSTQWPQFPIYNQFYGYEPPHPIHQYDTFLNTSSSTPIPSSSPSLHTRNLPFRLHNTKVESEGEEIPIRILERPLHTSVPAPEEDEMAPQNVSFIEETTVETSDLENLKNNLSQMNISSGSKTYRVSNSPPSTPRTRPTISSTFKQNRRDSNDGPSSLRSNSGGASQLSEEEVQTLSKMKTEILKDEAALGFVISFDTDAPKKPKPSLTNRRSSTLTTSNPPRKNLSENSNSSINNNSSNSNSNHNSSSEGSYSRKENVPPDVMICIDMNLDDTTHNSFRKTTPSTHTDWYEEKTSSFSIPHSIPLNRESFVRGNEQPLTPFDSDSDSDKKTRGLIIGSLEPEYEMQKKKERIMLESLKRKQIVEERKLQKEEENRAKREKEALIEDEKNRKKEEDKARRDAILEQYRLKKEIEKLENENGRMPEPVNAKPVPKMRPKNLISKGGSNSSTTPRRPRPKTIHVDVDSQSLLSGSKRGSNSNLSASSNLYRSESRNLLHSGGGGDDLTLSKNVNYSHLGKQQLSRTRPASRRGSNSYINDISGPSPDLPPSGPNKDWSRRKPYNTSDEDPFPRLSRLDRSLRSSSQPRGRRDDSSSIGGENDYYYGGSMRDLTGRNLGRTRKSSSTHYLGPGSLPGFPRRRGDFDDGASDISSTASGFSAYSRSGTRLYREPATKSNRPIILNSIEYVVFPGVVNAETRNKVIDIIDRCDCPHFLLLFRDQKCQFRGLYAYYPDTEETYKIYGTGPKTVTDKMFEIFFKYNSGGKKFTKIHTKHLSVTIDAFTIHNSLWLGKKGKLPDKRDMALVI